MASAGCHLANRFLNFRGDQFIREYDGSYFLTAPEQFVRDHYLKTCAGPAGSVTAGSCRVYRMPFRYNAFVRKGIQSFFPSSGTPFGKAGGPAVSVESNMLVHAFRR